MPEDPIPKWKFAIGTTSIVPDTQCRLHYVIVDIDTEDIQLTLDYLATYKMTNNIVIQHTCRGYHIYTNAVLPWRSLLRFLRHVPNVDHKWLGIGEKRGYLYLADKTQVNLTWKVIRMVIYVKNRRKGNTG